MTVTIDTMQAEDWPMVRAIYEEGIATRNATFEIAAPEWDAWDANHLAICRFVAREAGRVIGWAALSPASRRAVYAGVAEVSIYVTEATRGRGVGKMLLQTLAEASEEAGIWTLQTSVFPENIASLALHQACGFRIVGRRERIAQLDGVWRDTVLIERRSDKIW
jgi:L-amino acid N-acyltransferase YncA